MPGIAGHRRTCCFTKTSVQACDGAKNVLVGVNSSAVMPFHIGSTHILSSGLANSNSGQKMLKEDRRDIIMITTSQAEPDLVLISLCGSLKWTSLNISLKET